MSYLMEDIEKQTAAYSEAHAELATAIEELDTAMFDLKREKVPGIIRRAKKAMGVKEKLREIISFVPELFERPRTLTLNGIKVGYQKSRIGLSIEDPDRTVALIKKHLPEMADQLLDVKVKPKKAAISDLSVATLRQIGVEVGEGGDEVVVKLMSGDVDKLIAALQKEAEESAW